MEKKSLRRMSIKLSDEMHEWIQSEADSRGLTMNALIVFALETYKQQREVAPQVETMKLLIEQMQLINKV
jgi:macrodomain Ter protein organizer (MatP/YcbG family)